MAEHNFDGGLCPACNQNCRPACDYLYNVVGDQTYKCTRERTEGSTRCIHHLIPFPPQGPTDLVINGAIISAYALTALLNQVTNPDPNVWYRYIRQGDQILVTCKREE